MTHPSSRKRLILLSFPWEQSQFLTSSVYRAFVCLFVLWFTLHRKVFSVVSWLALFFHNHWVSRACRGQNNRNHNTANTRGERCFIAAENHFGVGDKEVPEVLSAHLKCKCGSLPTTLESLARKPVPLIPLVYTLQDMSFSLLCAQYWNEALSQRGNSPVLANTTGPLHQPNFSLGSSGRKISRLGTSQPFSSSLGLSLGCHATLLSLNPLFPQTDGPLGARLTSKSQVYHMQHKR